MSPVGKWLRRLAGQPELVVTPEFQAAMDAVRSGDHVFITGRAGTGKSTLLTLIRERELGRAMAVIAPTGVAALNVQGETVHRFFGFRPSLSPALREYRPPRHLDDVDMLIVDEVSMARADLIDMMDTALRRRRESDIPFGGVQMVLVGDLYQLPPVVTDHDADSALRDYSSPYFFAAKAFRDFRFKTFELAHVFRQRDDRFIQLLNAVRDGSATEGHLAALNEQVDPERAARPGPGAITLTTTNRAADTVNQARLTQLGQPIHTSRALAAGEFDPSQYRAELDLSFAVGAQVMMLVNSQEYVNGSLGRIVDIAPHKNSPRVAIELAESGNVVEVRRHTWEITRPVRREGQLETEVVGSFTQLPFRLAWAVTVHKSQGKTFDDVVFDRGRRVFASGQLYVALSRCTSLQGLTLKQPLRLQDVITDPEVRRFHLRATAKHVPRNQTLRAHLGYVGTGGGEWNKLVELAVVRETADGGHVTFATLVNPLRDVTDAIETGIHASDVAVAPTVDDLRGTLGALLSGTVLVTDGLGELHRMLNWTDGGVDEGLGIDLRDHGMPPDFEPSSTALDRAHAVQRHASALQDDELPVVPLTTRPEQPPPPGWLLPRAGHMELVRIVDFIGGLALPPQRRLALLIGLAPGAAEEIDTLRARVDSFARHHGLDTPAVEAEAAQLVERLTSAANRNATFTPEEVALIDDVATAFGVPTDPTRLTSSAQAVDLAPGMRVCFTGSPPSGADQSHLSKASLRAAAAAAGLEEVPSVTKTKCDLVVAFDPSSMSGKAKKARDLGKPLLGAADFLDRVQRMPSAH